MLHLSENGWDFGTKPNIYDLFLPIYLFASNSMCLGTCKFHCGGDLSLIR